MQPTSQLNTSNRWVSSHFNLLPTSREEALFVPTVNLGIALDLRVLVSCTREVSIFGEMKMFMLDYSHTQD